MSFPSPVDPALLDPRDLLEEQVREAVRQAGVDPVRERDAVRALVAASLAGHDLAVLKGSADPLAGEQEWAERLVDAVAGFGPLQRHLDDAEVEEI